MFGMSGSTDDKQIKGPYVLVWHFDLGPRNLDDFIFHNVLNCSILSISSSLKKCQEDPFWGALFVQLRFALLVWFAALIPSGYIFLFSAVTPAARELVWTWPLAQLVDILLGSWSGNLNGTGRRHPGWLLPKAEGKLDSESCS
jgi:hypothetical protein